MGSSNPSFRRRISSSSIRQAELQPIKGFKISPALKVEQLIFHYSSIGFQASHLSQAAQVIRKMQEERATIFLAFTSNMVSSGLREIIAQLCQKKLVDCIITSTGAVEEDAMKCLSPFLLGRFEADDAELKANGMNRIGNIFVKDEQYVEFEKFHLAFMEKMHKKYGGKMAMNKYVQELGLELKDKNSFLYWCSRKGIPVFLPGPLDGAMGDHFYFFNKQHYQNPFVVDAAEEVRDFYDIMLSAEKAGGIILGGGIAKHHLIGAAILRNGLDFAVYLSTGSEYDGSLSGARPREAVSWNKLKSAQSSAFVEGDATLTFPLIACFMSGRGAKRR
ncbi:MAG: deoxyhypusine synthase family protein [Candidatus Micrarchaeota archaeon]|nr:deoxyhypusine synthase family protein [Candidatus Micrarchaeota archaeon]